MKNYRNSKCSIIFLLMLALNFYLTVSYAQENPISGDLETLIPTDPKVKIGVLENGMKYYIRKNSKPENRVELRLVVNAGSILEDEDQRGLAHFVEHMAFNGTKNFKKNELVDYLQSIGVEFGADLNAYTSFDETVYMLPIPTDKPELVDKGLQILEDWAHQIEFADEEIDKERGVITEEWRIGQGAEQRMEDQWIPVYLKDSRYAERLPIGKIEVVKNAPYETIRKFYRDWYRPDLMAVVVVGDIDPAEMEEKIKSQFSKIKPVENPRKREEYEVPDHKETYVVIASDKEASFTDIQIAYKKDVPKNKTLNSLRQSFVNICYNGMIGNRLDEAAQQADPPFVYAYSGYGSSYSRTKNEYFSYASVGEGGVLKGLKALVIENEKVKRFGFTEGELERFKKDLIVGYEQAFNERDKTESGRLINQYISNFLEDEPIPGIEFEFEFLKKVLPTITLQEVNDLSKKWITDENRVIIVTGPKKKKITYPSEKEILAVLEEVKKMELKPYKDELVGAVLLENIPQAGSIKEESQIENVGITKLTLSNGTEVYLYPTDFKNDEILFSATSKGGHSLVKDEDYITASNMSGLMSQSGLADYKSTDIVKLLAGKNAYARAYVGTYSEGMQGSCAPKDLETMLQLAYMSFTMPREDEEAFQSEIQKNKMYFGNLMANPQYYFYDQVDRIMSQNHPRGGGWPTPEEMDKIDMKKVYPLYKERFANAADFKFFLVGNFEVEKIKPLLNTYLASLPATDTPKENFKDLGIRPPKGKIEKVIYRGSDPKSDVQISFTGDYVGDRYDAYILSALGDIIDIKLNEILREEKSGVYGVGARGSVGQIPYKNYNFTVSFPCGPENVEKLIKATFKELKSVIENAPMQEDINKVKEQQKRSLEENMERNQYWLRRISSYVSNDYDFETFFDSKKQIEKLNKEDMQRVAKQYLNMENYVQLVLMPEEGGESEKGE